MAELLCLERRLEEDGPDSVEDCFDIKRPPPDEWLGCFCALFDGAGCNEYFSERALKTLRRV